MHALSLPVCTVWPATPFPKSRPTPITTPGSLQVMSGFPVVAALMCVEDHSQLITNIDGFIDQLHRLLRDRRAASMALLCIARVAAAFIRRMSPKSDAGAGRGACMYRTWRVGAAAVHKQTLCIQFVSKEPGLYLHATLTMPPVASPPRLQRAWASGWRGASSLSSTPW